MNRIRDFRAARGWSLQRLAEAAGTSKSQIDKLEKGERRLTVDWMVRLAKPLGCDPRDLMETFPGRTPPKDASPSLPQSGGGAPSSAALIPIRKTARGEGKLRRKTRLTDYAADSVPRPFFLAHAVDAYALYVFDPSMTPMYRPRQLVFVNPHKPPAPGNGVVIVDAQGAVTLREFVRSKTTGIVVRAYHPAMRDDTIPQTDIAALHAIVGAAEPQ